jgi:hypothetical protein
MRAALAEAIRKFEASETKEPADLVASGLSQDQLAKDHQLACERYHSEQGHR